MRNSAPLISLLLVLAVACPAAETSVDSGKWKLSFDNDRGTWRKLEWAGKTICENAAGAESFNWGPGWAMGKNQKTRLARQDWDKEKRVLALSVVIDDWEAEERIIFGANGNENCIGRTLALTYKPQKPTEEPTKLKGVTFNTWLPKSGRYLLPATVFGSNTEGSLESVPAGGKRSGQWGIWPVLIEQDNSRTLLFIPDARRDRGNVSIQAEENAICVASYFLAQGWIYPGIAQEIGTAYLEIHENKLEQALPETWKFYDEIGLKIPADTPDWVKKSVLYSFHPSGTTGSRYRDLGGFAAAEKELLPQIYNLGIKAFWLLPVQEGTSPYWPRDYYKLAAGVGTPDEYRSFVAKAHECGMKVWQDNVPHGGTPAWGEARGNKPWWLAFDENGDALRYWCWDFANPEWQKYMAAVSEFCVREFDIDGYRIDACSGSKIINWARKGFPPLDRVPKNVPADYWKNSLKEIGGICPPLPYERGSLGLRQGGLQMIRGIRNAVKKVKPQEGAILAEVEYAPYMQEADVVYDFELAHNALLKMRDFTPAEYARGLAKWLEEQKYAEPRGTFRMRYVESHDSVHARGWLGVDATKAMTAVSLFIHGMPMIFHDSDVGEGVFLKKTIAIRNTLEELQSGEAYYQAVKTDPACVFACLRVLGEKCSLALVNLSAQTLTAKAALPINAVRLDPSKEYSVWNVVNGSLVGKGRPGNMEKLTLDLPAWGYAVLAFRPTSEACPVQVEATPQIVQGGALRASEKAISVVRGENVVTVMTAEYTLEINAQSGLMQSFCANDGRTMLNEAHIVLDRLAGEGKPGDEKNASVKIAESGKTAEIECLVPLPGGKTVSLRYVCRPNRIEINVSAPGGATSELAGIVLAGNEVARWQVNTAEGLLDDYFSVRHEFGQPSLTETIYSRQKGTPCLWQAETNPLHPNKAAMRCFNAAGQGVEIEVLSSLTAGLANAMALDKFAGQKGWHAGFFWRDGNSVAKPTALPDNFTLSIKPISLAESLAEHTDEAVQVGEVVLKNSSLDWCVKNKHYTLLLRRTGGVMRALQRAEDDASVLKDNDMYTDKGFAKPAEFQRKEDKYAASNDGESGVRIWQDGQVLRMRFHGHFRGQHKFGMMNPPIWVTTEYAFDGSPTFRMRWSVKCDGNIMGEQAFLGWVASLPQYKTFALSQAGQELLAGTFVADKRSRQWADLPGAPLPDTVVMRGEKGERLLTISELALNSPEPLHNIFTFGNQLHLTWLDEKDKAVRPGVWYEASAQLTVGDTEPSAIAPIEWVSADQPAAEVLPKDSSFETMSADDAVVMPQGACVKFERPSFSHKAWILPRGGAIVDDCVHSGRYSACINNPAGEYQLVKQMLPELRGGEKIRLAAWVKGENIKADVEKGKTGVAGLEFLMPDGKRITVQLDGITGTFDWKRIEKEADVPNGYATAGLRIGLSGAPGTMWIDDVEVERISHK